MSAIDWQATAKLIERIDGGSDMHYDFTERACGHFSDLVALAIAMPAAESARMVIDAGVQGTFNMGDIHNLAERSDFPG